MPRGSDTLAAARREEILDACAQLYEQKPFREITLGEIGEKTSFTRTSIYNYFRTKEEIFLALLEREYALWNADLAAILNENDALTVEEFSDKLARSLEKRQRLLKLLSMNHYDLESSSRIENLTEFKRAYGKALRLVACLLEKFFPAMTAHEVRNFVYIFFPYLFGIYPYTYVTEKQRTAMKNAGVDYATLSVYDLAYACVHSLLAGR